MSTLKVGCGFMFAVSLRSLWKHPQRLRSHEHALARSEGQFTPAFLTELAFEDFPIVGSSHFQSCDRADSLDTGDGRFNRSGPFGLTAELDFMRSHIADRRAVRNAAVLSQRQLKISDPYPSLMDPAMKASASMTR